jgi:hypothetical protein
VSEIQGGHFSLRAPAISAGLKRKIDRWSGLSIFSALKSWFRRLT